jgi:hypothetical protein
MKRFIDTEGKFNNFYIQVLEFSSMYTLNVLGKYSSIKLYPQPLLFSKKGSGYVAQILILLFLELMILLPLPLECWDYRYTPPCMD